MKKEILLVKTLDHKVELPRTAITFSFQFEISILNKQNSGEESNTNTL